MSSTPFICFLSRQLANQIAAGEVVERPASILKELLENSLDAKAHKIDIDVEQGGIKLISIRDDGYGIAADELALAVSRHATSKIHSLPDLEAIASMGFRGEALASIGSVSRLQLTSRQADSEQAWQLQISDADQDPAPPIPAAHPIGTTVETRNLFYNIPARRKFLRSERTEYRHLEEVVRRMALARFDVSFRLRHNQREIFQLPVATDLAAQERRLGRLCGKAFVQQARRIDSSSNDSPRLQLSGWVLPPEAARSQADLQFFFVNGRIIRDRLVNHALRQAYEDRIYPGRHAGWVLYLQLDPHQVDVNVHPTKHEVRFREARQVHDFLSHSLAKIFSMSESTVDTLESTAALAWVTAAEGNVPQAAASSNYVHERAGGRSSHLSPSRSSLRESGAVYDRLRGLASASTEVALPANESSGLQLLTRIGDHCLLAKVDNRLLLVDIPAARSYLLQQQLQLYLDEQPISQPLLFPLLFELNAIQQQGLKQQGSLLSALGFEWQQPATDSLQLRAAPAALRQLDFQQYLPNLLTALADEHVSALTECASLASRLLASGHLESGEWLDELWARQPEPRAGIWRQLDADELAALIHAD